jgi:hypothetical protein
MTEHPRLSTVGLLAAILAIATLTSGLVLAQTSWTAPRTAWGDPDLQGKWTFASTGTLMERPAEFGDREFLTPEEVAAQIEAANNAEAVPEDPEEARDEAQAAGARPTEQGIYGQEYNRFWVIENQNDAIAWNRTSLVIDPPDGKISPLTLAAVERLEQREATRAHRGEADTWEDRNLSERCISPGRIRFTANAREILQAPGYVVIRIDALNTSEPMVVPLDGRPRLGIRRWMGESRGHWDGDTLVVETTNFLAKQDGGSVMPKRSPLIRYLGSGEALTLTERFTRVAPNIVEYRYTVDDPSLYVMPYTVLRPLKQEAPDFLMPESACHEGNYGIVGQLSAARVDEEYAMNAAREEAASRVPQLQEMRERAEEWARTH